MSLKIILIRIKGEDIFVWRITIFLVGWFAPSLPWDGGTAQTAIQVHAFNLIELGKGNIDSPF